VKREPSENETSIIAAARAKHGRVGVYLPDETRLVIVRAASTAEHSRFLDKSARSFAAAANPKLKSSTSLADVQREHALSCMVHPEDIGQRRAILDDFPPLAGKLCDKANELAGDDIEEYEGN
jgi:hypothetical protein